MHPLMISISGVRGIVGESLTPEVLSRFTEAFGTFCGGTIVVGRDARDSGIMLEHSVFAGLMAVGCRILYLGISATPTIQIAVEKLSANGGIAITASHNPAQWNALKFFNKRGIYISEDDVNALNEIISAESYGFVDHQNLGGISRIENFDNEHIKTLLYSDIIKQERVRQKQFKVVVDCVNGAGGKILPDLLEELGCDVVKLYCEPGGTFPRDPEPIPENIGLLCNTVVKTGADIGFACDPDGDRLAVVDENGIPIGEEYSLVLAAMCVLEHQPGPVAVNVSTTSAIEYLANQYGVEVFRSKIGEYFVVRKMQEHNCVIGGEGNGGVIFPEIHYGRDAMVGAALILQLLTEKGEKLSKIVKTLPQYCLAKLKASVDMQSVQSKFKKLEEECRGAEIDTTDGLKLIFPHYWVHLRLSNTEPIIRVFAEASTKDESFEIAERYLNRITND